MISVLLILFLFPALSLFFLNLLCSFSRSFSLFLSLLLSTSPFFLSLTRVCAVPSLGCRLHCVQHLCCPTFARVPRCPTFMGRQQGNAPIPFLPSSSSDNMTQSPLSSLHFISCFSLFYFISLFLVSLVFIQVLHLFAPPYDSLWVLLQFRRKGTPALTWQYQSVMWWSGLRGAIAFALAIRNTSTVAHQVF